MFCVIIRRAFKYRTKHTKKQGGIFHQFAGAGRWISNRGLEKRNKAYKEEEKTLTYYEQNNELVTLKEEFPWLKEIHSQVLQQSLKDLDSAFKNFFRNVKEGKSPDFPGKKKGGGERFFFPLRELGLKVRKPIYLRSAGSSSENH